MAKIEDLIKNISDPRLRDEIAQEVAKLKATKKFGLVFEEHIPETVQVPSLSVRVGVQVAKRGGSASEVYRVIATESENTFRIAREPDGDEEIAQAAKLVVVKPFGEPLYPTLVPVDRVTRAPGKQYHTIINAENFHALQLLLYCYEGQIDVIYIDPPYNTGARDWKYSNNYVDANDQYRHSKWLSMMKKRLQLAKRLLKPDTGVLIVTIDEHEVHRLGSLLDEELPETFRQMVTIVVNQKGVAQGRLSRVEEYAIFCFMPRSFLNGKEDDLLSPERPNSEPRWERLLRGGVGGRREDQPSLFFPIIVDPEKKVITDIGEPLPLSEAPILPENDMSVAWPIRTDGSFGRWRVSPPKLREFLSKGYVKLGGYDRKRKTWTILYLGRQSQNQIEDGTLKIIGRDETTNAVLIEYAQAQERQVKTVWHRSSHDAGTYGSTILRNIFGEGSRFSYPKSLYAVVDALSVVSKNNPDALILDFFAGSGTTLHATMLLNSEDDGQRRCILVTNNEVSEKIARELNEQGIYQGDPNFERCGICETVTYPRCKYVINGKRDDGSELPGNYLNEREMNEGFEENLEYFKLDFLDPNQVEYGDKFEAILPILWMMAGAEGERETDQGKGDWFIPKNSPYAVLINEHAFAGFRRELHKRADITHVFLVTDSEEAYRIMIAELPGRPKVKMLYKSYLDNFRINMRRTYED